MHNLLFNPKIGGGGASKCKPKKYLHFLSQQNFHLVHSLLIKEDKKPYNSNIYFSNYLFIYLFCFKNPKIVKTLLENVVHPPAGTLVLLYIHRPVH